MSSFNAWSQLVTKYVLDNPTGFKELAERLKQAGVEHAGSKAAAAALGFLMAKAGDDGGNVYDDVVGAIEHAMDPGGTDAAETADKVFSLIYQWIDKTLEEEGYPSASIDEGGAGANTRHLIAEAFANKMPPL